MASNKHEAKVTFIAETSDFTQGITQMNKTLGNLRSDLKLTNTELKNNGESFDLLKNKQKSLQDAMSANADKISLLEQKLAKCKEVLGENSNEYDKLYRQLNKAKGEQSSFQAELSQTESKLEQMGNEAEEASRDINKLGDAMDDAEGSSSGFEGVLQGLGEGFSVGEISAEAFGTALGSLASEAIQMAIQAIADFTQYLWELPEATEEFRVNMAKLQGSTQQYGYDVDETNEKMKELYGYFEDDQVCVNAISNLQGMGLSQEDLSGTLDSAIAVWTAYGDSIPIESLTESINETTQVGKVTGSLADALNWAGISEDDFNAKLEKCTTNEERAKLIRDTLNNAYGEAKKTYDENTQSIQEQREAEYELMQTEAELAEGIEPLNTAYEELKNTLLQSVSPAIIDLCETLTSAIEAFDRFRETPTWNFLKTTVGVIFEGLKVAFSTVTVALRPFIQGFQLAFQVIPQLWNAITQGIDVLGNSLAPTFENIKNACSNAFDSIKQKVEQVWTSITTWLSTTWTSISTTCSTIWTSIKDFISTTWDNICNVVQLGIMLIQEIFNAGIQILLIPWRTLWENIKDFVLPIWENIKTTVSNAITSVSTTISSKMNEIKNTCSTIWNNVKSTIFEIWTSIKNKISEVINSIKTTVANIWNSIKSTISNILNSIKSTVTNIWNSIKSTISNILNSIKSTVTTTFNNIKTAIVNPVNSAKSSVSSTFDTIKNKIKSSIDSAKNAVSSAMTRIKSLLSGTLSFPRIKLPHISISGSFSLNPPRVPRFSISYYKDGGIMTNPTLFGVNGNNLMIGGEAGAEAILPLNGFYDFLDKKLDEINGGNTVIINLQNVEIKDDRSPSELVEQLAFEIQRKLNFR